MIMIDPVIEYPKPATDNKSKQGGFKISIVIESCYCGYINSAQKVRNIVCGP